MGAVFSPEHNRGAKAAVIDVLSLRLRQIRQLCWKIRYSGSSGLSRTSGHFAHRLCDSPHQTRRVLTVETPLDDWLICLIQRLYCEILKLVGSDYFSGSKMATEPATGVVSRFPCFMQSDRTETGAGRTAPGYRL
jgi:hypothetical protein